MSIEMNSISDKNRMEEPKKVYETPRLTVHGSLEKITENVGNNGNPDGVRGSQADL
jgi:hypothetical protein